MNIDALVYPSKYSSPTQHRYCSRIAIATKKCVCAAEKKIQGEY